MIADMPFTYGRKSLSIGDEFEATDRDSLALRAHNRAHLAEEVSVPKKSRRSYKRRDMTAESS